MRAYVALGSNLGDRAAHLDGAIAALRRAAGVEVRAVSAVYETEPVGPAPQGAYLNAVVEVETGLAPRALLDLLLRIEERHGRVRGAQRNAARSLDLDLLLYGACCSDEPGLTLPHPRLHLRAFVLEPLCDLAPQLVHPSLGASIEELARHVRDPAAVRRVP